MEEAKTFFFKCIKKFYLKNFFLNNADSDSGFSFSDVRTEYFLDIL